MEVQGLAGKGSSAPSPTQGQGSPSSGAPAEPPAAGGDGPSRPAWVPDAHWNSEAGAINDESFGAHYSEIAQFHQAEQERLATIPTKPEDVKLIVPEDLQVPEGVELNVAEDSPSLKAFKEFVVAKKIDPESAQGLYTLYLQERIGEATAINERVAEEGKKLGPNKDARIDALSTFLTAQIGDKAKALIGNLWTATQVEALEALQKKFSSQGAVDINSARREAPPPPPPPALEQRLYPNMAPQKKAS